MRTNFGTEDPAPGWMDDQHCGYPRFLSFSRYIGDYATPLPVILGLKRNNFREDGGNHLSYR